MSTSITTSSFGVDTAQSFIEDAIDGTSYYVFAARHIPYAGNSDQVIPVPQDSLFGNTISIYDNMIFGKKVQPNNILPMVARYDWSANTSYAMYDDLDGNLNSENFYAAVNVGSYTNVYKCLYNNGNTASIVEPSGTDVEPFLTVEDGYVWQYMYTANDYIMSVFSTQDYIPVVANTQLSANAQAGAIDVIAVADAGGGYSNYIVSSFQTSADIKIGGNPYFYGLGAEASNINNFYNGCCILMTSGAAKNEYKIITNYYISNGQKVMVLNDVFTNPVQPTDTFEIYPFVYVFDTGGMKTANCMARAIVNPVGNTVSYVDIIANGLGYRAANAVIIQDVSVPVSSNAVLRPIMSPPGGHGYDVLHELGASTVGINVQFIENEVPFPTQNDYRTIGLIKNPEFANVTITINETSLVGNFVAEESIYQYNPIVIPGTVSINNSVLTGSNTSFTQSLVAGDPLLISNGSTNIYSTVAGIASNTSLTLSSNAGLTISGCTTTFLRNMNLMGTLSATSAGQIVLTNVSPFKVESSPYIIGTQSYCTGQVSTPTTSTTIMINSRTASDFSKFLQLTEFVGVMGTGATFAADEVILQAAAIPEAEPTAYFHSLLQANSGPNSVIYATNVRNIFQDIGSTDSDGTITGQTSGASFILYNKYNGELVPDSGDVVYMENLSPVTRSNTETETIKLLLSF